MKSMLTIALSAALLVGFTTPAFADEFDSNHGFQDGIIGRMASDAGVETASAQMRALMRAEGLRVTNQALVQEVTGTVTAVQSEQAGRLPLTSVPVKTRTESVQTIATMLITGEVAKEARAVRTRQRREGSAMVTTDYEHNRHEVYTTLERTR